MQWDEPVRSRDVAASRVPGTAGHVTLATAWTHAAAPPGRGAPSLMLWLDRPRAAVGEPVVLHLVTLGDAQCQGLGLLSGLQPVAGRIVVRAASAGRYQLAVRCVGAGGSVESAIAFPEFRQAPGGAFALRNRRAIVARLEEGNLFDRPIGVPGEVARVPPHDRRNSPWVTSYFPSQ